MFSCFLLLYLLSLKVFILSNITIFKFALNLAICKKAGQTVDTVDIEPVKRKDSRCNSYKEEKNCSTRVPPSRSKRVQRTLYSLCDPSDQYTSLICNHIDSLERENIILLVRHTESYIYLYILPSQATLPNSTSKYLHRQFISLFF